MKKIWSIIFFAAFLLFGAVACDDNNPVINPPEPVEEGDPLEVKITAALDSYSVGKGGSISWADNYKIGVCWSREDVLSPMTTFDVVSSSINNETGQASFSSDLKWDRSRQQQFFYAYSPVIPDDENIKPEAVPVDLPAEQTQTGKSFSHIDAMNIMVAKPVAAVSPNFLDEATNKPVELHFAPVFSILELRLAAYNVAAKVKSITIKSATGQNNFTISGGTVDITTPGFSKDFMKVEGGTMSDEVKLNLTDGNVPATANPYFRPDVTQPAGNDVFVARLMILPEALAGALTLTVETDNGTYDIAKRGNALTPGETLVMNVLLPVTPYDYTTGVPWDGSIAAGPASLDETNKIIEIGDASELAWLAAEVNKGTESTLAAGLEGYTVKLTANINLDDLEWTPIGIYYSFTAANTKTFKGAFDGQEYTVSGLKITETPNTGTAYGYGLFGQARPCPSIKNLTVKGEIDVTANAALYVGGIAGTAYGSSASATCEMSNCHFEGTIKVSSNNASTRVSGIAGTSSNTNYIGCTASGEMNVTHTNASLTDAQYIAGISVTSGNYINCWNDMDITATGGFYVAGIAAYPSGSGSIKGSKNSGNITIDAQSKFSCVGGVSGLWNSSGEILSSYNAGNITVTNKGSGTTAWDATGGLVGTIYGAGRKVRGCYNSGTVSSTGGTNTTKTGCITGFSNNVTNLAGILNNYAVELQGYDLTADYTGKFIKFASGAWPVSSDSGWATGTGTDDAYWMAPLPGYGTVYPKLWWED